MSTSWGLNLRRLCTSYSHGWSPNQSLALTFAPMHASLHPIRYQPRVSHSTVVAWVDKYDRRGTASLSCESWLCRVKARTWSRAIRRDTIQQLLSVRLGTPASILPIFSPAKFWLLNSNWFEKCWRTTWVCWVLSSIANKHLSLPRFLAVLRHVSALT